MITERPRLRIATRPGTPVRDPPTRLDPAGTRVPGSGRRLGAVPATIPGSAQRPAVITSAPWQVTVWRPAAQPAGAHHRCPAGYAGVRWRTGCCRRRPGCLCRVRATTRGLAGAPDRGARVAAGDHLPLRWTTAALGL